MRCAVFTAIQGHSPLFADVPVARLSRRKPGPLGSASEFDNLYDKRRKATTPYGNAHPDLPSGAVLKGDARLHAGTCWQRCIGNCLRGRLEQINAPSGLTEAA
jgi:hypothetical protein